MNGEQQRSAIFKRLGAGGLAMALVGGAVTAFGYSSAHDSFFAAYLTAFIFWFNLTLGSLAIAMLHGLSGGGWGTTVRRVVEAGYETLPIIALAFVPIWLFHRDIYEWSDPAFMQHVPALARKAAYLNVDAWRLRAVILFASWFVSAGLLRVFAPGDSADEPRRLQRLQTVSGIGLFAYVFSLTIATVDWVMSLEPHWFSTMYGVLYIALQAVAALALAIVVVSRCADLPPWTKLVRADRLHDLGTLLFAFVMFSAYVQLMQFLIVWSADLPEENVWYLARSRGPWLPTLWLLVLFAFATPYIMLLSRARKRDPQRLQRVAILILVMSYVSIAWLVMPGFTHGGHGAHAAVATHGPDRALVWLAPAAWCAIGGVWIAWFAWRLAARSRVPLLDDAPLEETAHDHAARPVAG